MSFAKQAGRLLSRMSSVARSETLRETQAASSSRRAFSTGIGGAYEAAQSPNMQKWGAPVAAAAALGAGIYYATSRSTVVKADESASAVKKFVPENAAQLNPNDVKGGTAPEQPVQLPPFTTTDQTGQEFGLEQLQGEFAMLIFGVTRNFEDAKSRLENLSEIVRQADRKSNMQYMRALFVSEEPQQDAPEKMSGLLQDFKAKSERRSHGPRILGLTGPDVTKVREMVNKFNEQVSKEGKTEVVHAGDPDGTLFLINPDVVLTPGQLVAGFKYAAHGVDTKEVTNAIAQEILSYTHSHPQWHAPKKVGRRHA